jgi:hypothetical protein
MDRPGDVLHPLIAHVLEREAQLVLDVVAHGARNADAAGFGQRLEPRRDVDAIAVDIVAVDDDVAEIDPDAEIDAAILAQAGVALGHAALNFDGAAHRVDDAGELDEQPVARGLDDAPLVLGDLAVDQLRAMRLEALERVLLVDAHQPAVADDVRREDGAQLAGDVMVLQGGRPFRPRV